ncbi:MAG: hypothetical protein IT563_14625 [Alphaproteobacteria bacterium]|nr:hypothetical protein [Alphaproteobacteria bacterium]
MSAFTATNTYDTQKTTAEPRLTVQHGVMIRNTENLRKLNELLASGWRVVNSTAFEPGAVLLVIEAEGDPEAVAEFRQVFGTPVGTA